MQLDPSAQPADLTRVVCDVFNAKSSFNVFWKISTAETKRTSRPNFYTVGARLYIFNLAPGSGPSHPILPPKSIDFYVYIINMKTAYQ